MVTIREEFGEEYIKEFVTKTKRMEQVGVLRALPFIINNSHFVSQFDEVMSLHAFSRALDILEEFGWVEVTEGIRGRKNVSLTEKGKKATKLYLQIIELQ